MLRETSRVQIAAIYSLIEAQDLPDALIRLRIALRNLLKEPPSKEVEENQGKQKENEAGQERKEPTPGSTKEQSCGAEALIEQGGGQEKENAREAHRKGMRREEETREMEQTQVDEAEDEETQMFGEGTQAKYKRVGERRVRYEGEECRPPTAEEEAAFWEHEHELEEQESIDAHHIDDNQVADETEEDKGRIPWWERQRREEAEREEETTNKRNHADGETEGEDDLEETAKGD